MYEKKFEISSEFEMFFMFTLEIRDIKKTCDVKNVFKIISNDHGQEVSLVSVRRKIKISVCLMGSFQRAL